MARITQEIKAKHAPPSVAEGNASLPLNSGRQRSSQEVMGLLTCLLSNITSYVSSTIATPHPAGRIASGISDLDSGKSAGLIFSTRPALSARNPNERDTITTS